MTQIKHISWQEFHTYARELGDKIAEKDTKYFYVYATSDDAAALAQIVAQRIGAKLLGTGQETLIKDYWPSACKVALNNDTLCDACLVFYENDRWGGEHSRINEYVIEEIEDADTHVRTRYTWPWENK